jgi:hypothetical protein
MTGLADSNQRSTPEAERALRFGYLLSEIELSAKAILAGREHDIPLALIQMDLNVYEAKRIAAEVSREALDGMKP